jgi:hypothetical protein
MAGHDIHPDDMNVLERIVAAVAVEYFFENCSAHESAGYLGKRVSFATVSVGIGFKHGQKSRLGDHDLTDHFHAFFTLFLLFQKFAFA